MDKAAVLRTVARLVDIAVEGGTQDNTIDRETNEVELPDIVYSQHRDDTKGQRMRSRATLAVPVVLTGVAGSMLFSVAALSGGSGVAFMSFWATWGGGSIAAGGAGVAGGAFNLAAALSAASLGAGASAVALKDAFKSRPVKVPYRDVKKAFEAVPKETATGRYTSSMRRMKPGVSDSVLAKARKWAGDVWKADRNLDDMVVVYDGEFVELQYDGIGRLFLPNGVSIQGWFHQGLPSSLNASKGNELMTIFIGDNNTPLFQGDFTIRSRQEYILRGTIVDDGGRCYSIHVRNGQLVLFERSDADSEAGAAQTNAVTLAQGGDDLATSGLALFVYHFNEGSLHKVDAIALDARMRVDQITSSVKQNTFDGQSDVLHALQTLHDQDLRMQNIGSVGWEWEQATGILTAQSHLQMIDPVSNAVRFNWMGQILIHFLRVGNRWIVVYIHLRIVVSTALE
jgi:hypothetical protein